MSLRVLAVATLLFLPVSVLATHDSDGCAQVAAGNGDSSGDRDRDDDGLIDAWEKKWFGDLCQDGEGDYDHDGASNAEEQKAGTDPTKAERPAAEKDQDGDDEETEETDEKDNKDGSDEKLSDCKGRDDRNECVADYCEDHRDDKQCQALVKEACERRDCAALSKECAEDDERSARVCAALSDIDEVRVDAKHIDFSIDRAGRQLVNYTVGGTLVFTSIAYGGEDEAFEVRKDDGRLRFQSDDARLEIHDSATGEFWFRADDGFLVLDLPDGAALTPVANGHIISYADRSARIAGDYAVDGQTIIANDTFRFFSPVKNGADSQAVDEAKAAGKLGAEARISKGMSNVTAFDDVDVNISMPERISAETPLRVLVSAHLAEGRTIILDVDPALMTGPDLELRYFDVLDDGNETEVVFRMADSLADILDPSDDGGQPEYWVVRDDDGIHVMASIPHWSTHAIELASVGEFLVQPSILIGAAAGVVGVGVASVAMFWPRRQDPF